MKNPLALEIGYGVVCAKKLGFWLSRKTKEAPRRWCLIHTTHDALVILCDLLALADVLVTPSQAAEWTVWDQKDAGTWAAQVHLKASDNSNHVMPKPEFLKAFPTVSAAMLKSGSIV